MGEFTKFVLQTYFPNVQLRFYICFNYFYMNKKGFLYLILLAATFFQACKPDCEKGVYTSKDYLLYKEAFPYLENDTILFYRPNQTDTIQLISGSYDYPQRKVVKACDCCEDEMQESMEMRASWLNPTTPLIANLSGDRLRINILNESEFEFPVHFINWPIVPTSTPDSTYNIAYEITDFAGNKGYYVASIGIVKYVNTKNEIWLKLK